MSNNFNHQPGKSLYPGCLALLITKEAEDTTVVKCIHKISSDSYIKKIDNWYIFKFNKVWAATRTTDVWEVEGNIKIIENYTNIVKNVSRALVDSKYLMPLGDDGILDKKLESLDYSTDKFLSNYSAQKLGKIDNSEIIEHEQL